MNFQNTVLAATVGLLTCPDACLDDALARCDGLFDSTTLYSTDKPSVAVRSIAGVTPLREWVMDVRAGGVLACWPDVGRRGNGDSAAHMMAGFLGGRPCMLHVRHVGSCKSYGAGTISSAAHAMNVAQFADLINAQASPEFYWQSILADINQFHSCNGIAAVEPDDLADFLQSDAGAHAWDVTGDQIVQEIQVEALTFGESFLIPAHLADFFEEVVPVDDDLFPYVWLDAYDKDEVTGSHLYQLIVAQAFHAEIWRQCADPRQLAATLGEDFDLTDFPHIDAGRWPHYLQGLDAIEAELVRDDLLKLIRLECQQRGCEPVIPPALEEIFGPDEEERRRLSFRGHLQHDMGWYLKSNAAPWCMFVFDEEGSEVGTGDEAAAIVKADHQQRFETALDAIVAFAVKVQSPFVVHFQLAQILAGEARADAPFSREAFERICTSNNVPDYLADTKLVDLFAAFGWGTRRVFGLAAVAAADVFGAMGSWNDQSFEGDEDAQFEAVSAQLFGAMNGYLEALLTVELRDAPGTMTPVRYLARQLRRLLPDANETEGRAIVLA
jgi:hypothetical protein